MQTTSKAPTNAEARVALRALLSHLARTVQRAQLASRSWWILCWILLAEQVLDVLTTALALPLGAHELNPLGAFLYIHDGVLGIATPKLVYALILLGLTLYFSTHPTARRGRWTALGFISSIAASAFYGVAMLSNIATLIMALLDTHHMV